MRSLSETIARLSAAAASTATGVTDGDGRLTRVEGFGSNPGALAGWAYVPEGIDDMPLVVVLHGCTQTAAGYDRGAGWSDLADRFGFCVLLPEQSRSNNPNGCFNWFASEDTSRGAGEVASIHQLVSMMLSRYAIAPDKVFITGLSAGGAMASAMLATYPEIFAGGAIIAGLPYGAASSMSQAFERMKGRGHPDSAHYAEAIRAASPHRGAWPSVSVWHGGADATVDAMNADRIVEQWRSLQCLAETPDIETQTGAHRHRVWNAPDGRAQLEEHLIAGMGHGTPLATSGAEACGTAMPYMLDVGISSSWHIADAWGLLENERARAEMPVFQQAPDPVPATHSAVRGAPASGVQATIEAALRTAGLMR